MISLSVSIQRACAATRDGTVQCWGNDGNGAVAVPRAVANLPSIVLVAVGWQHAGGLTAAGAVWCWGSNESGQLGNGNTDARALPVQVAGLTDVVRVVAGANQSLAVRADGQFVFWGFGVTRFVSPARLSGAVALASSLYDSCVVLGTNRIACWTGVPGDSAGTSDVQINGGGFAALALHGDSAWGCATGLMGSVLCWGQNGSGQLGDGTTSSTTLSNGLRSTASVAAVDLW